MIPRNGKAISIALLQTLARRPTTTPYFNNTGLVILDEAHRVATKYFSSVIPKFKSKYRIALTATPKKKDKSDTLLYNQFGTPKVIAKTSVMPVNVVVKHITNQSVWGNTDREIIASLSRSHYRNAALCKYIKSAYLKGRTVLGVTNSVKHAQKIISLLSKEVPIENIGQFTATKFIDGKPKKVSATELIEAKTKRIIIATDGLIKEGVDIPALDCGIDLVPFYNATQRIGRVRRYFEGKKTPYWLTILDVDKDGNNIIPIYIMYKSRYKDYEEQGFTITISDKA